MKAEYGGGKWFSVVSVKYFTLVVCTLFGTSAHAEISNQEVSVPPSVKGGLREGYLIKSPLTPLFKRRRLNAYVKKSR